MNKDQLENQRKLRILRYAERGEAGLVNAPPIAAPYTHPIAAPYTQRKIIDVV